MLSNTNVLLILIFQTMHYKSFLICFNCIKRIISHSLLLFFYNNGIFNQNASIEGLQVLNT